MKTGFIKKFIDYVRGSGNVTYSPVLVNNTCNADTVKKFRNLLSDNGVNLNKVRFVTGASFSYDIDKNEINPTYVVMMPSVKGAPIIEIGRPDNVIRLFLADYIVEDNYSFLREAAKNTKKGIVLNTNYPLNGRVLNLIDLDGVEVEVEESQKIL
jgi:hypothetical protein